uniref:Immunoglobulin superfamily member 10 n=1 Tax=Spermophilus dauricus TaxID=99837 RepID=A0A8C9UQ46_SPEDA
ELGRGRSTICLLVPFTGVLLVTAPGSRACPRRCTCYVSTEVHCTFRYLTSIPESISPNVERINLGYNSLVRLMAMDFSGLSKLELLLLHSNGIHTIADRTFSDLQALQVLKMSYNKVRKLEKDTFHGLRSLTRLHMDHNNIEFINPEAFYGLSSLRLLQLEGNQLTKLHPDTFVSLRFLQMFKTSFLKYLYLSDNFLPSLPQEMLSYMPALQSLYLHGNPWVCDCHLRWLSDWMQEKPDVIKCKKDRGPSGLQLCPACMNPQSVKGRPFALVPAATFLCVKPTINPSLQSKRLIVPEDSGSASISPQDFLAPLGSLTLNMTDQFGNKANVACSVQKPLRTRPMAFTEENNHIFLNLSLSIFLVCDVDPSDIQPVWHILALYSDAPLTLERNHLPPETPQLRYKYRQVAPKPEDIFTNVEADLRADPSWLMQNQISLQLNRTATTLGTLQIQFASEAQVTLPATAGEPGTHKWTMISRNNDTKLEHTVLVGGTITLDCPGQGEPSPHLEWLLADGSKVRAPYVSEDGRILIDKGGKLELQMADGSDSGMYHCVSTNYGDADVLSYRITVVEPRVEALPEQGVRHTVFADDTLDLPCHATGTPDASVSWVLPGSSVLHQSSGGKQILNNGTLRIPQVTPEDQGQYCCVAANPSGVAFLLYQVSVKTKGQRPSEQEGDADGSGLGEPSPSTHSQESEVGGLPPSAPLGAQARRPVSRASKNDRGGFTPLLRGGSAHRGLREHRRHFPPSARRIDPQHWAALLERAKKNTVPQKQESTTAGPPTPGSRLLSSPGEEEGSSGVLPPEDESVGPTAPSAMARVEAADPGAMAPSPVANRASDTEASPMASPPVQPENPTGFKQSTTSKTTATPEDLDPSRSSQMHGAASQNPAAVSPPMPRTTEFQESEQMGRYEHLQKAPPTTQRTVTRDALIKTLSSNNRADVVLESVNTTNGHQTPVTGASEPRSNHFYSYTLQGLSNSRLPSEPHVTADPSFQVPRSSTAGTPLPRRFGRRRKIWGRGRIISPYRTPVLRRHRYGMVGPAVRGSAEESTTTPSASELPVRCLSCPPTEALASATTETSSLGPPPSTHSNADVTRVTANPSTTLAQNPSLSENKPEVDIDKTSPTIKYISAESSHGAPTAATTPAPTSTPLNQPLLADNSSLSVSTTSEARGQSGITPPLPGPVTKPPVPTALPTTRFSIRKIPWHQIFVNNYKQKGILKNLRTFGLQKSTATMLPRISPALPTNHIPGFPPATFSARLMQIPPVTLAATHHNTSETPRSGHHPTGRELLFPSSHSLLPTPTPRESSTLGFQPVQTASLTGAPAAPTSVIIYKTQAIGPRSPEYPGEPEPRRNRNDLSISPGQSAGLPLSAAVTPVPAVAETSLEPGVSAFTPPPLEDTGGISSTTGLHSRTLPLTDVPEGPPQETTQTLRSTIASEMLVSSKSPQSTAARKTSVGPSTRPPFLSSHGPLAPIPTSLPPTQTAVTDRWETPIFKMRTDTVVTWNKSLRHDADLQQLAAAVTAPPQQPDAKLVTGAAHFANPSWGRPTLTPRPRPITIKSQDSKWTPLSWPENQFGPKSYPEISGKGKNPVLSELPTLSLPEATSQTSNWDGQKTDKKASQKITTFQLLPSDSFLRSMFEKPRIVGGNAASFTVPAHSDAFLPCTAVGNPPPTVHWIRVSSGLELSKRKQNSRFQVHPNGTLSIQRVSIQDRGQYLCSASNPFGSDHLHVTLSVVSYPPRILERRTEEITVYSGSTMELTCRAEGRPSPTVSWILANQSVVSESSTGNRQALVTADGALVIRKLSIYDRGFYKCVASNSAGQDSRLVRVQVIAAPPVILEQKRQVLVGRRGESLELPCTAEGTPQPLVHWVLADGTEVKPLQASSAKWFLGANGTLHISNLAPADRGTYECIATSSTGSERRVVMLRVEGQETSPRIEVASPRWTEVNLGDELLLNCSAAGDPTPKIIWRLPSRAVVDQWHRMGSRLHVYPNGSLFIGSVTEKDGGDYLCVARNSAGDDLTLMHVSLRLKPAKIHHKPHFRKQVLQGRDFQVDCKASGSPEPEISWSLPNGRKINQAVPARDSGHRARRYTLFDNGTLYFHKVGITEEGDYTCHAQNTLGKDEMRVHLTVLTAAPRIRRGYQTNVRLQAGDTAVLDCEVVGEPKPGTFWLLPSGDTISSSSGRYTVHVNGSLSVSKVRTLDSGEYVCVAQNPSGHDTEMYTVAVDCRPPMINGIYANKTVIKTTAVRHSKKHLHCRAEGTPPPQVTWVMPDSIVLTAPYYGSRVIVHANGTLEIRNVRLSDSAEFICVARNEGGESKLVVQLEVLEMLRRPTFRNPLNEKVVAQLGQPTALNCSVDGNPPPEIIWILPNGTQFSNGPHLSPYLVASNGSLLIHKTTRKEAGRYRCAARNQVGYIEKLIVLDIGQKPVIVTYALGTVRGLGGESLWLHCVSDGIPKPHIKWTTPGGSVLDRPQSNGKYTLHENGTLVIKEATAHDGGNYVCQAQNSVGQALITLPVRIVAYPPRITNRPPRSILTRTGVAFQLHCVALGVPKPEVTWEMPVHSWHSRAREGRSQGGKQLHLQGTLVLPNPQTWDSGLYRCTARNALGSDSATTYIQVI